MTTDNRTNEEMATRLRQFAESQAMDFDNPHIAMTLEEIADRLTGTITEAQVEAAAKTMHEKRNPWFAAYGDWGAAGFEIKQAFRESARAALVAAQGAAPQVESADCDRDRMGICKRCGMGWDARKVLDGDFACPVLPSSGADEAALAEVIARVTDLWDDPLDEVHDIPQIARAVAEWLKE